MNVLEYQKRFCLIVFLVVAFFPVPGEAHETQLHEKITETAALSSAGLQTFLGDNFAPVYAPFLSGPNLSLQPGTFGSLEHSPVVWMKEGSRMEDDEKNLGVSGARCKNHFYDPITGSGLTDRLDAYGISSFTWASIYRISNLFIPNYNTWPDARIYQLAALVEASPSVRQANMANMCYTLGHVLHLNQDTSSPDHVRNDNHFHTPDLGRFDEPFGPHWIEQYGGDHHAEHPEWFAAPSAERRTWNYWRSSGFKRLKDFWDRDK